MSNWAKRGWPTKGNETPCGHGSTIEEAQPTIKGLRPMLDKYKICILNDAGCGDLNWISHVDLSGIDYHGYDVVDWPKKCELPFSQLDITKEVMRPCEAILCRDVLIHFCNDDVLEALARFRMVSGYLITTSHYKANNNLRTREYMDQVRWHYSPIDLKAEPFNFPEPCATIEGPASFLGLWEI